MISLLLAFALQTEHPAPEVAGEPALPAQPPDDRERFIPIPGGGYVHRERRPDGSEVRRVVLPAVLLLREGPIELFACAEGGKEYESLFRLVCDVGALDIALTLSGLSKGPTPDAAGPDAREGDRALVFVQWTLPDGSACTVSSHDLVLDAHRQAAMPRTGWTYVARVTELIDTFTGEHTGRLLLTATRSRSLITTWRDDGSAILQNPLVPDALDDARYNAYTERLPEAGTRALVILRAPAAEELVELRRAEER